MSRDTTSAVAAFSTAEVSDQTHAPSDPQKSQSDASGIRSERLEDHLLGEASQEAAIPHQRPFWSTRHVASSLPCSSGAVPSMQLMPEGAPGRDAAEMPREESGAASAKLSSWKVAQR